MEYRTELETAFPRLSADEMSCLEELGRVRNFDDGEALFSSGDRDYSFFAVKSGAVSIFEDSSGTAHEVVLHTENTFTGDVDLLTGRPSVVTAVSRGGCEVIEIDAVRIRRMLNEIPSLSDKLLDAFQTRRKLLELTAFQGIRLLGYPHCKDALYLQEFFYKNNVPYTFFECDSDDGRRLLSELEATPEDTPILACSGHIVRKPSLPQVAECLGISRRISNEYLYDVLIVGAGPAGLAAAVYGASEGLKTLVVDRIGPGGQAGQSSKIENYMGFPSGLPGAELANRGYLQALKFGADFTAPVSVVSMTRQENGEHHVELCTGQTVRTKSVLIATGVSYRRLPIKNCERFEGSGVYYSATSVEARMCREATAIVVGGGNSAGQAAMHLAKEAHRVKILLRGDNLRKSMSDYLASRIEASPNIDVLMHTEVDELLGGHALESIATRNSQSNHREHMECAGLFVFVGAKPHTEWLPNSVATDEKGFVLAGPSVQEHELWTLDRPPCELETTSPGVFAAGDVRSGTTKRCAFAVGDGALGITCVNQYLHSS